jgi:hypothetical protein
MDSSLRALLKNYLSASALRKIGSLVKHSEEDFDGHAGGIGSLAGTLFHI